MIPVKLTIQGLYSYQEKQTIDFTRLTAANLFGIFGAVGSGKSSVLEAITFAIYGKTDRLNLSGDNRNYNMMNLKSNELLIDFIFETGREQTAYRAVVKGRRNSKRFDDVKALERAAYRKNEDVWQPVDIEGLEKAIGLSYDNFKRTIIIPQGQFQEFLQLGNKDRTRMMKELFNLGKYELYYPVVSLENKNNAQKQNLEGQLQQLGVIDPEQLKQYEEQLDQLKKELQEQGLSLEAHQKQESQYRQLQELVKKLAAAQLVLKQLDGQEAQFLKLEQAIRRYEQCMLQFKYILDTLDISNRKIEQKTMLITQGAEKLKREEEEIGRRETLLAAIKTDYDRREELKQRADELGKLLKIKELDIHRVNEQDRLKKGGEVWQKTIESAEKLRTEKEKLEVLIKSEKAGLPDLAVLAEVKAWHVEKKGIDRQVQELQKELIRFRDEEKAIRGAVQKHCSEPLFQGMPAGTGGLAAVQFLGARMEAVKKKLRVLEQEADHFRVKVQLQAYAETLQAGEPCPLCGSVNHPEIYNASSIAEEQDRLRKARLAYEKELELMQATTSHLNELESQLKFNSRHLKDLVLKDEGLKQKLAAHKALFKWDKYQDEKELEKAFQAAAAIQRELNKKEMMLEDIMKTLDKTVKDKERFQNEMDKIRTALTRYQTEIETLKEQLKIISAEACHQKTAGEIGLEKDRLLQQHNRLEKQYQELLDQLTGLRKSKDTLRGSLDANRKELQQEQEANILLMKQLDDRLARNGYATAEEVKRILAQPMDPEKEKQKLDSFKNKLAVCREQTSQLQHELNGRVYDASAHQQLLTGIAAMTAQWQQRNQEFGKIAELLKKLKKDMENQASLRKQLEVLELRAENIRTMKSLFKGSGFVNYISSVYLQNLCHSANDRFFQLTRQKLSLEIDGDNNFQVRDFMNGGKLRSVKTLSGGQTFQAALSLALALADNIQKITESNQNFFFLDEGFGSLDKDSLSVVFETLKSLRKENRMVGVISHVEEMQQEIDIHLRIENHGERGSLIVKSWMS